MYSTRLFQCGLATLLMGALVLPASAQSFRVQCPTSTITHPIAADNNSEPAYPSASGHSNGAIKCQQISGGDGYATMGDGTQTYLFSFGPLSGLGKIATGQPGTDFPMEFNTPYTPTVTKTATTFSATALAPGDPATTIGVTPVGGLTPPLSDLQLTAVGKFYNGAIGQAPNIYNLVSIYDISEVGSTVTVVTNAPLNLNLKAGDQVRIAGNPVGDLPAGYQGIFTVTAANVTNNFFPSTFAFQYTASVMGLAEVTESPTASASTVAGNGGIDGHVDPRQIMDVGVMNGNIPAPLMAIDEDDEFFLTLSNVGMIMRPDLFEQHTVHFHGYPNASAFYDGVPDASVAINIGASFTYYYLAPDAGTYFWHCHITPPEHLQMGMVGQIYVRPRQNRVSGSLYASLQTQQGDLRTACRRVGDGATPTLPPGTAPTDILCSNPVPLTNTGATGAATVSTGGGTSGYAYNDGDGSTYYDIEYPIQIHGFDPNFHFVGMTFNPEGFADMKDKYFLLNGRSYPDTLTKGPLQTQSADGVNHFSQPLPTIISMTQGQKALLRISDLDVTEFQTLASLGIPMKVVGYNAKLLRDQAGNNMYYNTNSITLGGGESLDVILDSAGVPKGTYYLYTPNLDHLSNDAENFGGLMTEVRIN